MIEEPPGTAQVIDQPKIRALIDLIADFDTVEVKSEPEALLLEGKLIKQWRPRYNTDFTDDKRFLLVRIDLNEDLPRFRLTRIKKDDRSRYFGPFAHSGLLRKTLAQMRRQFGILLGDGIPQKLPDGQWRLYDAMWGLHIMDLQTRDDTHHPILIVFASLATIGAMLGCVLLFRRRKAKIRA